MKKKFIKYIYITIVIISAACNKQLDINDNPNSATAVEPELILPGAIVRSASLSVSYNTYGASLGGYIANAGGFSGFGALLTYNFTPGYLSSWGTAFDNLLDYRYVINETEGNNNLALFNAVAKIMTVLEYHRVIDQHGDVPYSEALLGAENIAPKYDKAEDVYKDLIVKLDEAVSVIDGANFPKQLSKSSDPLFNGNLTNWKKFANTLKLRLLIRIANVPSLAAFVNEKFASLNTSVGFLTEDAIVNPGYVKDRPNPTWATWGYTVAGNVATSSRVPTYYVYGFYNGTKITDSLRGKVIFNDFGNSSRPTPLNQLGIEAGNPAIRAGYSPWYTGVRADANSITSALGVVKDPTQGQPIFLAAESYFLQAEAQLFSKITGDVETSFNNGIKASFKYLYTTHTGEISGGAANLYKKDSTYFADNNGNYLVDFSQANSTAQKLEAIITQKYIAVNMINSEEGWNDYRRTGYPVSTPGTGRYSDMASTTSNSTRVDKLPTILIYPQSEIDYNSNNSKMLNPFSDLIFWAKQ